MRIAMVAPLFESVPPRLYGGTERVVHWLTEELVREGHDVTLFASGDSRTSARLVSASNEALRLADGPSDPLAAQILQLDQVLMNAEDFDVIHWHIDLMHLPGLRRIRVASVTTQHGRLDLASRAPLYRRFRRYPVVSISDAQREPAPRLNWVATVHHGMPLELFRPPAAPTGGYLAFLGRISPEKGFDRAIEIARRAGMPLRVAAKVDPVDAEYYRREIVPLLEKADHVELVGEIGDDEKPEFLGNATGLVTPIDWPEPFGLVMIEAMACGTPVVAYRRGSVPEVVDDGITGFAVEDVGGAVEAVGRLASLDRDRIRETFERRFSAERMAREYLAVFGRLIEDRRNRFRRGTASGRQLAPAS